MKTALFINALVTVLVLTGYSFAANKHYVGGSDTLHPGSFSDKMIVLDEPADNEDLKNLLLKLNDPDPFVRVEAVQTLGEIQKKKSLVSVCGCLTDENIYVRAYAAEALGKIGKVDISLTLSRLLPALDDPSPYVRAMMVSALGELQDERAADSIRNLLHDEDESVRGMAAWALNNIEQSR